MKTKACVSLFSCFLDASNTFRQDMVPTFESARKEALDLYTSLISRAPPKVRAKISALAQPIPKQVLIASLYD
jgi:hypothetical protein